MSRQVICRPGSFWFSPGFDDSAKSFINAHKWPSASNHCYFESVRWSDLLRKNGFNAEIKIGWFGSSKSTPSGCLPFHSWVTVNGNIFDPTFSQFEEIPSAQKYKTDYGVGCWDDLMGLAFSLAPAFLYFPESIGATLRFSWPPLEELHREFEALAQSNRT
jgi:hypothetical protein